MKKIAIIPAFNEEKNIEMVILSIKQWQPDFDIVVINDGSVDLTSSVARQTKQAVVIDLSANIGIGETSRLVSFTADGKIMIWLFR